MLLGCFGRPRPLCVASELACELGGGGHDRLSTGTVECCLRARVSDLLFYLLSPEHSPAQGNNDLEKGERAMDVIHPRCAGIDCSKKDAKVCVRIQGQGRRKKSATVSTWGATTGQILALREHLVAAKVTCVVIESTSDYWKPFYYLLDDAAGGDAGQRRGGAQSAGPQDRRVGCSVAGRPGRARAGKSFVRATSTGPGIAGSDSHPHRDHSRTHPRSAAPGKTARRHRHQTVLGGLRHHRSVRARHARGVDRRAARPRRARRTVPRTHADKRSVR